jgi:hypothetical protein
MNTYGIAAKDKLCDGLENFILDGNVINAIKVITKMQSNRIKFLRKL